mmetsp:Transcript_92184/g.152684  ORF Transcript_92184/g.152684 Transcript_92184/m.152684 type:complete len:307 (-) Transcript_92184:64-984(-)
MQLQVHVRPVSSLAAGLKLQKPKTVGKEAAFCPPPRVAERQDKDEEKVELLRLCVLPATRLSQLRDLVILQLASRWGSSDSEEPRRPATAPARASGNVAASLCAAASGDSPVASPKKSSLRETLSLRLIFQGRLLTDEDAESPVGELGFSNGAVVHCVASTKARQDQSVSCYPHSCSTDGGRVVHVLGEQFPFSTRIACRFGTVAVDAHLEDDDGEEHDFATLRCVAPPHPAGAVTLSISFDGGVTWLGGPTFWYVDPSAAGCPLAVAVPASCRGLRGVQAGSNFGQWEMRWDRGPDDRDPGAGCV